MNHSTCDERSARGGEVNDDLVERLERLANRGEAREVMNAEEAQALLDDFKRRADEIAAEKVEIGPPAWWQWPIIWWRSRRREE